MDSNMKQQNNASFDNASIKLSRSEEKFNKLFELSPVGMAMIYHDSGEFLEVNQSLLNSTGYTKDEFMAMSFWDITPEKYRDQEAQQMIDLEAKGKFGPNEKEYIRKDGSLCQIRIRGFMLEDVDGTKLVWGIIEDISNQYKRIFEDMQDVYLQTDANFIMTRVNQYAVRQFKYSTQDELIGIKMRNLFADENDFKHLQSSLKKDAIITDFVSKFLRMDKTEFWGSLSIQLIKDANDHILSIEGILRDVNDRITAQKHFVESELHYRTMFENAIECIFESDMEGNLISINSSFTKVLGYDNETDAIESISNVCNKLWLDCSIYKHVVNEVKTKGFIKDFECDFVRKDGTHLIASLNATMFELSEGNIIIHGSFEDITEQKKTFELLEDANNDLKILTERMILATQAAKQGIWDWDIKSNILLWDKGMYDLYGINKDDFTQDYSSWINRVHPDDREKTNQEINNSLTFQQEYIHDFRILLNDGSIRYISAVSKTFYDNTGAPSRMVGINWDISSQVYMENILKEQKLQLEENNKKLSFMLDQSIKTIAKIAELRDPYTAGHQRKVQKLACAIASKMGLDSEVIKNISYGSAIHDIGKIQIASEILSKPGRISEIEMKMIHSHVENGYNIVKEIDFPKEISIMIHQHHERLDGSGYPLGLKGDQIILESRILAVSDVVEAMTSHRPYRAALEIDVALDEIKTQSGIKYDPKVVEACVDLFKVDGFEFSE
jgi:PAS domain S-box-containing protein/putative nucleotidyltransferase with HDIG domain